MWQSSDTIPQDTLHHIALCCLEGSTPQDGCLFLFIALARMVTLCKEGGGMLSVWALRARSYKTKAEAWQQGNALHPLQGVFLVFVLLPDKT